MVNGSHPAGLGEATGVWPVDVKARDPPAGRLEAFRNIARDPLGKDTI